MSYDYKTELPEVLTDQGQRLFLRIRDKAHGFLDSAGAFRMNEILRVAGGGSSWTMLACVDRMVELGEIREIPQINVAGQDRVFVKAGS